ncbi:hypothetical protein BB8028_0006g03590 [Beauveria bassiana]|uniref:Uncharacterized protein n=1 Tax=Beauveria bassiana TaxID=176275 RepID=A0A2S7YIV4_BEABA|nr:hypothetical protein BB8028_0006g03590 [Beauveria bassiana]
MWSKRDQSTFSGSSTQGSTQSGLRLDGNRPHRRFLANIPPPSYYSDDLVDSRSPEQTAGRSKGASWPPRSAAGLWEKIAASWKTTVPHSRETSENPYRGMESPSSVHLEHVENSEEPHGVELTKAPDDTRLAQQDVKAEQVRQLRYASWGSSYQARLAKQGGPILPQLPPSYYDAAMSLSRMKESNLDRFDPIRQARVSELRELRPVAPIHNAKAAEREDDNVERADTPAPYASPPKRTLFGSILDWTKSLVKENVDGKGRWLCSVCTAFLNTMNPHDRDRRVVERMHQTLGIWPPFKRVPKVTVATRICARCHQSTNCVLFAYYEAD